MEVQGIQQKVILLSKIKKFCYFILPMFFGFTMLQIVCNTSMPLAVARGQSMQPNIHEVPMNMRDILPERITHRVIEINHDTNGIFFRTQGDNAPPDTYEVRSNAILGKNIAIIPYIGMIFILLQTPLGMGAVVVLFIVNEYRGN